MKKAKKAGKPSKAKAPARKSEKQVNPFLDLLKNMDEDVVASLRQTMQKEMGLGSGFFDLDDPVDLFAEFLEGCARGDVDDDEKNELLADLVDVLSNTKVDSNGGDRAARRKIKAIYEMLDDSIEKRRLQSIDLMMIGKVFADAGLAVPDSLRRGLSAMLNDAQPDTGDAAGADFVSSLLELADQTGQNAFEVHEFVNSFLVSFPTEARVALLRELINEKKAAIDLAVIGFVLHPDAVVSQFVADAFAAAETPVESALVRRLVLMRPWLPQTRQAHLDAAIEAVSAKASPPVDAASPKPVECYASVCDGSGARSLIVTQRVGRRFQLACVMMKPTGVADAMVIPNLSKSQMDDIVNEMKSSAPTMETDLSGVARMLGLGIADNLASGNLPPFKLVEVVESLGLGPIHPDHASPIEIITSLLADSPPEQTDHDAARRAHADVTDSDYVCHWFEAGEELEHLLFPIKGSEARVAELMKVFLPGRRHFWARQCALSSLAMRGDKKAAHAPWREFALVGRDIASDLPLDQIPLMKQIAETSVLAFEQGLYEQGL
jgi:hypothetical protein